MLINLKNRQRGSARAASVGGMAFFAGLGLLAAAGPAGASVLLQPHRIVYEISLGPKSANSSFASASGLIALEFTGNACEGYDTNFRQAAIIGDSDGGNRNLDFRVRLWEEGAGKRFRFSVKNQINGQTTRDAEGEARRVVDGSVSVLMKRPKGGKGDFDGAIAFPSAMMIGLVEAAQSGQKRFDTKVFDGSEGGEKVYETIATIGERLEGARNDRLEAVMRTPALDAIARWPTTVAYFDNKPGDRVPVYSLRAVTFANGVVSDLQFAFPDFSLNARAVRYEALDGKPCSR